MKRVGGILISSLVRLARSRSALVLVAALAFGSLGALPEGASPSLSHSHAPAAHDICQIWWDQRDMHTRVVPTPRTGRLLSANLSSVSVTFEGFTPAVQQAFMHALALWSGQLQSPVVTAIHVQFTDLGNPLLLGSAGPTTVHANFPGNLRASTWFPAVIANKNAAVDLNGTEPEIIARFNSTAPWYLGTDGATPSGQIDFVTVALHELGHGLGIIGSAQVSGSTGAIGFGTPPALFPTIYDTFVADGAGTSLLNAAVYPNGSTMLAAALQSNNLWWTGPAGIAGNGGAHPRLYAPSLWRGGSSYAHLDESAYPPGNVNSLMTPMLGSAEAMHLPGPITLGMLNDSGWSVAGQPPCTYRLDNTPTTTFDVAGAQGASFTVTSTPGCGWQAVAIDSFITITGGASGSGTGVVTFNVAPNTGGHRRGSIIAAGIPLEITQSGAGPITGILPVALEFGAVTSGSSFVAQTSAQAFRILQHTPGTFQWSATPSVPWLKVSPATGTGPALLSVTVVPAAGVPASGKVSGSVWISFTGAQGPMQALGVTLTTVASGASARPFGSVDSPPDNQTGVTGAIPVTGWALDDTEVTGVIVCREPVLGETFVPHPACGGAPQVFLGAATIIENARPDVSALYKAYPLSNRAGWGLMVLTNMLPSQGNGTYTFVVWAHDREGQTVRLGSKTVTCSNATAMKPFGAIDTPQQGGVASGSAFVNFGWVLTPQPKMIPADGSTIAVLVDGQSVGTVTYNNPRPDIQGAFPGFTNTNGAVGFRVIDTTALQNGRHTISWTVADNQGAIDGIGSRFFSVSNGEGSLRATATMPLDVDAVPASTDGIHGRRGWNLTSPLETFRVDRSGRVVVRSEEVSRIELHLGSELDGLAASSVANSDLTAGQYVGYERVGSELRELPVGSRLDPATGVFTWAPGVGYIGAYDLVFVSGVGTPIERRHDVRVVLQPKGSHLVGPQVMIDTPRSQQDVGQPFHLGGWAADLSAASGTGVSTLHAWAYPLTGGPPVFLGATEYGGTRPDVAVAHGDQFEASGFGLNVQGLTAGNYDLAVFAWSTERAGFVAPAIVRVTVRP